MRLDPRAGLCLFAVLEVHALEQELGCTGGYGGPCPHLPAWHPTCSSHQLERDIKPQISTRGRHSGLTLLEPGRYRELSSKTIGFSHWKTILSGKKCVLKGRGTQVFEQNSFSALPVAQAAPKGERGNLEREQELTRGSLTLVLVQTSYRESALHFLSLLLWLRPHLIPDWLCISHFQPGCRLLG